MRVGIFFDGKNFYKGWRATAEGVTIDFAQLAEWLVTAVGGSRLWGAYYYTGIETGELATGESQRRLLRFLDDLELLRGFFVQRFPRKARRRRCAKCGQVHAYSQEKEVDTTMVADMLRLAAVNAFDAAILVSGDSDHAPAVEGVRAIGKQVYVATWGKEGLSPRVRKAAFDHIDLKQGLSEFSLPPGDAASRPSVGEAAASHQAASSGHRPPPAPVPGPRAADTEALFLEELARADRRFENGYVGANYFLKRWKSRRLTQDFQARNRILQKLVEKGKVQIYEAPDGNQALRAKRDDLADGPA